ncbi:MAG TPA: hypothetical protein PLL80_01290 [Candidatus Pacearchaeota archaeon]|nr:hypothetical protein [Candidatus Pacearchaeota archaeon]HOK94102.1 hypothetical protein [Candidatus Pacearchaeota archaeon]HPO75230.1 hypothetical protein [Candidatus Pacearchaeota archaeon]
MPLLLSQFLNLLASLWWLWLAILLYFPAKYFYLWAKRDLWSNTIKWTMLEIRIPEEIEKTPKAMENVFHSLWSLYDTPSNIKDYWVEGKGLLYYSFEIVGKRDQVHFYIRTPSTHQQLVKSAIWAEYPGAEIKEVDDYVNNFGKDIPNEDYNLWGADLKLVKPDAYPIKTYTYWETEMTREEKRLDPLATLFEAFGNLEEGEEVWVQIKASPVTDDDHPYIAEAQKIINKIMKRPQEKKPGVLAPLQLSKIPSDIWTVLIEGKPIPPAAEEKMPSGLDVGLMKLSPGEAEALRAIEENLGKYVYEGNIRFLYIAKRNIYSPPRGVSSTMAAFNQFATVNLNAFTPDKSKTKVAPWFFEDRRLYVRRRKIFRHYTKRLWPWHRGPYIFSTEELATLYHFPGKNVVPAASVPRVELKKGEVPPNLPT